MGTRVSKWPPYTFTLDAIIAAVHASYQGSDPHWHPEDVSMLVVTQAEAVGAALGHLLREGLIEVKAK